MKLKVKIASLSFEQGTFNQGDIIEVSDERALLFAAKDVEVLSEEPVKVEVKPLPKLSKKVKLSEVKEAVEASCT